MQTTDEGGGHHSTTTSMAGTPIERQAEVVPSIGYLIERAMRTIGGGGWHRTGHTQRMRDANEGWPHLRHMGIRRTGLLHPHRSRDEPAPAPPPGSSCNGLVTTNHNPQPSPQLALSPFPRQRPLPSHQRSGIPLVFHSSCWVPVLRRH